MDAASVRQKKPLQMQSKMTHFPMRKEEATGEDGES
jgi:hypothetical protein